MPCFIGTVVLLFAALNYQSGLINGALSQGYFTVQRVLFYGFGSALFLAALIELEKRGVVLFQKASMLLGGASYSMYLAHAVILYFITRSGLANSFNSNGLDPFWTTSGVVLLMIIYSVLHYLYLEKPIMKVSRSLKKVLFKTSH